MKKRLFLIVSSIVCAVVSLSQVIYTIVASNKNIANRPNNDTNVNVNIGGTEYESVDVSRDYLLGDIVDDELLNACHSQINSSILTYDQNKNAFVASKVGVENYQIISGKYLYNYTVEVWEKGDGSQSNPYVIVSADDFVELVKTNNGSDVYYSQKADLDLSDYSSWVPVGNKNVPFASNYDGNGYAIKNMRIVIDETNINDYVSVVVANNGQAMNVFSVGFFGCVDGLYDGTIIQNINIENAIVDTTAIDGSSAVRAKYNFAHAYVGILAGMTSNCEILGNDKSVINSTINSSMSNNYPDYAYGAVAGMVGMAVNTKISGYDVNVNVESTGIGFVGDNSVAGGHKVAGVVGALSNSTIKDCNVNAEVETRNYPNTRIAGVAYYVVNSSVIENVNVETFKVNVTRVLYSESLLVRISGVADQLFDNCKIDNSHVLYANVEAVGTGQVAGLVNINYGTIVNSSVQTDNSQLHEPGLKGTCVAGLVDTNNGTIEYNENFNKLYAVDVALRAQTYAAGLVLYNYGNVIGETNLTELKAQIYWLPLNGAYFEEELIDTKYMLAGLACVNAGGTIKNFTTIVKMYDAVNAAGAVGYAGDYTNPLTGKVHSGGTLENLYVNSTVRTLARFEGKTYSEKTNVVSGLIGFVNGSTTVKLVDVCGHMDVNYKAEINPTGEYSLDYYGSVVGVLNGNITVSVSNSSNKNFFIDSVYSNNGSKSQYVKTQVGYKKSGNMIFVGSYSVVTDIELI